MQRSYVDSRGRWGAVPEWAAALALAGRDFRVLIAIAAARDRGKDTVTISIEEIAVKTRIDRRNVDEHGLENARQPECGRGARHHADDHDFETGDENESKQIAPLCAERGTNRELARSLRDGV